MKHSKSTITRKFHFLIENMAGVNVERLPAKTTLWSLGLDRTNVKQIMSAMENDFNLSIRSDSLSEWLTLEESIIWLERLIQSSYDELTDAIVPEGAD